MVFSLVVDVAFGWIALDNCESVVNLTESSEFKVGGPRSKYADGLDQCWVLNGAEHVTVVFDMFQTEYAVRRPVVVVPGARRETTTRKEGRKKERPLAVGVRRRSVLGTITTS